MANLIKKAYHILGKSRICFCNFINRIQFRIKNVQVGRSPVIFGILKITGTGRVVLGDQLQINSCAWKNLIGGDTRTVFSTFDGAVIEVGDGSGISNSTLVARERITIGKNVNIGGSCKIYDNDFHSVHYDERMKGMEDKDIAVKPVRIEDGAFIGANSIILKGVTIGSCSVVGAGSVVAKSIPPYEIWAGNPARKIKELEKEVV